MGSHRVADVDAAARAVLSPSGATSLEDKAAAARQQWVREFSQRWLTCSYAAHCLFGKPLPHWDILSGARALLVQFFRTMRHPAQQMRFYIHRYRYALRRIVTGVEAYGLRRRDRLTAILHESGVYVRNPTTHARTVAVHRVTLHGALKRCLAAAVANHPCVPAYRPRGRKTALNDAQFAVLLQSVSGVVNAHRGAVFLGDQLIRVFCNLVRGIAGYQPRRLLDVARTDCDSAVRLGDVIGLADGAVLKHIADLASPYTQYYDQYRALQRRGLTDSLKGLPLPVRPAAANVAAEQAFNAMQTELSEETRARYYRQKLQAAARRAKRRPSTARAMRASLTGSDAAPPASLVPGKKRAASPAPAPSPAKARQAALRRGSMRRWKHASAPDPAKHHPRVRTRVKLRAGLAFNVAEAFHGHPQPSPSGVPEAPYNLPFPPSRVLKPSAAQQEGHRARTPRPPSRQVAPTSPLTSPGEDLPSPGGTQAAALGDEASAAAAAASVPVPSVVPRCFPAHGILRRLPDAADPHVLHLRNSPQRPVPEPAPTPPPKRGTSHLPRHRKVYLTGRAGGVIVGEVAGRPAAPAGLAPPAPAPPPEAREFAPSRMRLHPHRRRPRDLRVAFPLLAEGSDSDGSSDSGGGSEAAAVASVAESRSSRASAGRARQARRQAKAKELRLLRTVLYHAPPPPFSFSSAAPQQSVKCASKEEADALAKRVAEAQRWVDLLQVVRKAGAFREQPEVAVVLQAASVADVLNPPSRAATPSLTDTTCPTSPYMTLRATSPCESDPGCHSAARRSNTVVTFVDDDPPRADTPSDHPAIPSFRRAGSSFGGVGRHSLWVSRPPPVDAPALAEGSDDPTVFAIDSDAPGMLTGRPVHGAEPSTPGTLEQWHAGGFQVASAMDVHSVRKVSDGGDSCYMTRLSIISTAAAECESGPQGLPQQTSSAAGEEDTEAPSFSSATSDAAPPLAGGLLSVPLDDACGVSIRSCSGSASLEDMKFGSPMLTPRSLGI